MIAAYNALSVRPDVDDGAATYSVNLLRHLPGALPGARVIAFVRRGETRLDDVDGLELVPLPVNGAAGRLATEVLTLGSRVRAARADVFISPNESLPWRLPCPPVVVAQNLVYHRDDEGAFLGATPRERLFSRVQAAYYRGQMRRAYRRAAAVVAVSAETARVLTAHAGLDPARVHVVPEGSDSVLLPAPGEPRPREPRLLVVSTLAPYKNHERALDVFAALRRTRPELELVVVGGDWRGCGERVRRHAAAVGVGDAARFVGALPAKELVRLYETSSLLLHLSGCESFGLPVVEAMRYGLPVVAADRSSLPETAGGAAVLVDPDDPAGTASRVSALLADRARRAELADAGRRRAAELTWTASAAGVAEVVRRVTRDAG